MLKFLECSRTVNEFEREVQFKCIGIKYRDKLFNAVYHDDSGGA